MSRATMTFLRREPRIWFILRFPQVRYARALKRFTLSSIGLSRAGKNLSISTRLRIFRSCATKYSRISAHFRSALTPLWSRSEKRDRASDQSNVFIQRCLRFCCVICLRGYRDSPIAFKFFAIRQTTKNLSAQWKRASNWRLRLWQAVSHILCCCTHQKAIRICKWRTIVAGQSTESGRDRTIGPTNSSCTWSKTSSMCFREESSAGIEIDPPSYPSRESPRALITRGVPLIHSHSDQYPYNLTRIKRAARGGRCP